MTAPVVQTRCLDAETLAAFAEGKLRRAEIAAVLAHLDGCAACLRALQSANDFATGHAEDEPSFQWWRIAVATAAMMAIVAGIPFFLHFFRRNQDATLMAHLVELSSRSIRTTEPRLSGGFAWAPYRGRMRASGEMPDAGHLRLSGAAGDAVANAQKERSAAAQHTAGVALLLIGEPAGAVARLREATQHDASDARAWSDLAAAEYGAAQRLDRPSLYAEALAASDRALRLDGKLSEALFNRALILERLGLTHQAHGAWLTYLQNDPSSPWAAEAREHLKQLQSTTGEDLFRREQPRFERAAANGETAAATQFVGRYRQQSRAFAEAESLGQWGEATARGEGAEASRLLAVARATGNALATISGETLLRDAVASIDRSDNARRLSIAEAHRLYRRGRLAFSRHEAAKAESDLRRAASLFAAASDPMSRVARYYAASARFDQGDVTASQAELEGLLAETLRQRGALALAAQIQWELSLCFMVDDDWQGALPHVAAARSGFEAIGERSNLGFVEGLLADTLISLGRADEAWAARIRAFGIQSAEGRGDRLAVSINGAARNELRTGRLDVARAFVVLEEAINRDAHNDVLLTSTLAREALLDDELGDADAASRDAREAELVAQRIPDAAMRARGLTDAHFATGALLVNTDQRRAIALLGTVIDGYQSMEKPLFLPECHLLRARAERRIGDDAAAAADLDRGIATMERHRLHFAGPIAGSGIFDAGRALFQDAIRLRLDGGQIAEALAYAERSRAHVTSSPAAFSLSQLQTRLAGSGSAILELVVLPDEVAGFVVTDRNLTVHRHRMPQTTLRALAERVANEDDGAARDLYDLLIRPQEAALANASRLIVVGDPALSGVPFAALIDGTTKRRLLERVAVASAPDAASLQPADGNGSPQSLLTVSLPARIGDGLSEVGGELHDIAGFYRRFTAISGDLATFPALVDAGLRADVIHIAGHTEQQPGAGDRVLVFASGSGTRDAVSWRTAARASFDRRTVVVLAACETLRTPPASQTFSMSLGDGFLAAGAGDVIGTLYPIPDNEARTLFAAVHRNLAARFGPAESVRRAQLEALAAGGRTHAWRALALVTRHTGS